MRGDLRPRESTVTVQLSAPSHLYVAVRTVVRAVNHRTASSGLISRSGVIGIIVSRQESVRDGSRFLLGDWRMKADMISLRNVLTWSSARFHRRER